MPRPQNHPRVRRRLPIFVLLIAVVAGTVLAALAAVAVGRAFTLSVAKNAKVTDQKSNVKHESIGVGSSGFAVYWLSGDNKAHPKCTASNGCFKFWPPLTVASAKKASKDPAIKGKLSTWKRGKLTQVVLGGHPLYFFSVDKQRGAAKGEGVVGFGGTWHVLAVGGSTKAAPQMTTTTATTTTTPPPYTY
jgi:predicted lipoprotein with Yx(FWY)xxD motif